jgi:asparagine synthase (glutamine-hydrolysing)
VAVATAGTEAPPAARLVDAEGADSGYAVSGDYTVFFAGVLFARESLFGDMPEAGADRSDAEVVAAAYEQLGPAVLQRLRGSFAFVLWDRRRK